MSHAAQQIPAMHLRRLRSGLLLPLLLLAACVTINVYFPVAAAEAAADRIIGDVWGPAPGNGNGSGAADGDEAAEGQRGAAATPLRQVVPEAAAERGAESVSAAHTAAAQVLSGPARLLNWLVPPAQAQPNLEVSSPEIRRLTQSMRERHGQLLPHYQSGAIGLTADGRLAVRDLGAVPLPQRAGLRQLVAAENADRDALYREIARVNGQPEWEDRIREVFADRWAAQAQSGWWYQAADGSWQVKP